MRTPRRASPVERCGRGPGDPLPLSEPQGEPLARPRATGEPVALLTIESEASEPRASREAIATASPPADLLTIAHVESRHPDH